MRFWPAKQTPEPVAVSREAEDAALKALLKQAFQNAAFGQQCRTRTYHSVILPGQSEWMETRRADSNGWNIVKKTRTADHPAGAPVVAQKTLVKDLTFFDAVEYLARYEAGQTARSVLNVDEKEIEKLAHSHFVAFAEREGIAFDIDGQPHPTKDGQIVTDGQFPETKFASAQMAAQEKTEALQTMPISSLAKMDGQSFERIKDQLDHIDGIILALQGTVELTEITRKNSLKGKDHITLHVQDGIESGDSWVEGKFEAPFQSMLKLCRHEYDDFYIPVEILPAVHLFKYHFFVFEAANIRHQIRTGRYPEEAEDYYSDSDSDLYFIQQAEEMLNALGYSSGVDQKIYKDVFALVRKIDGMEETDVLTGDMRSITAYLLDKRTHLELDLGVHPQGVVVPAPDFQKLLPSP